MISSITYFVIQKLCLENVVMTLGGRQLHLRKLWVNSTKMGIVMNGKRMQHHVLKKIQHKLATWEPKLQHLRMMETNIVFMQLHNNMKIPHKFWLCRKNIDIALRGRESPHFLQSLKPLYSRRQLKDGKGKSDLIT